MINKPKEYFVLSPEEAESFKWSGLSDGAMHSIQPIQLLNGSYALPMSIRQVREYPMQPELSNRALGTFMGSPIKFERRSYNYWIAPMIIRTDELSEQDRADYQIAEQMNQVITKVLEGTQMLNCCDFFECTHGDTRPDQPPSAILLDSNEDADQLAVANIIEILAEYKNELESSWFLLFRPAIKRQIEQVKALLSELNSFMLRDLEIHPMALRAMFSHYPLIELECINRVLG